jgi:predicted permease
VPATLSLSNLARDLRLGVRQLYRSPLLAVVAITTLALGIGANTAIFTVAKSVLFDRLSVDRPQDLRVLAWTSGHEQVVPSVWGDVSSTPTGGLISPAFSYTILQQMRAQSGVFQDLVTFKDIAVTATIENQASVVPAELLSGNAFTALGLVPPLGRTFNPAEDNSTTQVAVVSHALYQQLGAPANILGKVISVNGVPITIIGVAPQRFTGLTTGVEAQLFFPITLQPQIIPRPQGTTVSLLNNPESWWAQAVIRLRPNIPEAATQTALDLTFRQGAKATLPASKGLEGLRLALLPGSRGMDNLEGNFVRPSYVLLALSGLVLLLACVNLTNLLLARTATRQREFATRLALGASHAHILRFVLIESLLLAIIGGAAGFGLGYLGQDLIPHLLANQPNAPTISTHFDSQVFLFALALSFAAGILLGIVPAWQATRDTALSDSTRLSTATRSKLVLGRSLVVFQIGLSTVLLVGAGLFTRTLSNLNHIPLGFRADHLLLFRLKPPAARYTGINRALLYRRLEESLAAIPGVRSVSASNIAIIGDGHSGSTFHVTGMPISEHSQRTVQENSVGPDFFPTMGIPLLRGRNFTSLDTTASPLVAIVNEALARKFFPNGSALGSSFTGDSDEIPTPVQIVGIVADTRYADLRDATPPTFYLDYQQYSAGAGRMVIELRTASDPAAILPQVRAVVASVDRDLPLTNLRTMDQQVASTFSSERIFAQLTGAFGFLALILAAIGVYGIMAYNVARRTSEIGIRTALGAQRSQILSMILRESSSLAFFGVVLGIASALALAHFIQSMLYDLTPTDPVTLVTAAALLFLVALFAALGPALRATRIDPTTALRAE